MVIDPGGGTIDIGTYITPNNEPLRVEELCESECESGKSQSQSLTLGLVQGGEFVTGPRGISREMIQERFETPFPEPHIPKAEFRFQG